MKVSKDHSRARINVPFLLGLTSKTSRPTDKKALHLGLNLASITPVSISSNPHFHSLHVGASGRGKSIVIGALAEHLAQSGSVIVLDPHGKTVKDLATSIACNPRLAKRTILFDVNETGAGFVGYNPFQIRDGITESAQIDGIMQACLRVWGHDDYSQTPTLERWLRLGFTILRKTNLTFAEAPFLFSLSNNDVRQQILNKGEDMGMPNLFMQDWDWFKKLPTRQQSDQMLSSYNRVFKLGFDDHLRVLLGTQNGLNLQQVMDEGKILLVNLNSHRGSEIAELVGMLMLEEKYHFAKLRPDDGSALPCHIIVEELSQLPSKSITEALPQTRKFGVFYHLVTQFLRQFERNDPELLDSVLVNTGVKVVFGGGTHEDCQLMVDTILSAQLNLLEPKRWSVYFAPIQRWMDIISKTKGEGRNWSETDSEAETNSESETEGESWQHGTNSSDTVSDSYGTAIGDQTSYALDDPTRIRKQDSNQRSEQHGASHINGVTDSVGGNRSKTIGKSQQRGRSTQKGGSEQTSETTTPQLVTFYQQMEQVASQYSLDEQRYRATALLQNLPVATAAIKIGNAPTEIVGIKYISPPNVRPGGKKWMLAQVQKQSCVLPYDQACKALDERHAQLFGVSEKPRGKTETPFQPKQKGKDDPDPFVF